MQTVIRLNRATGAAPAIEGHIVYAGKMSALQSHDRSSRTDGRIKVSHIRASANDGEIARTEHGGTRTDLDFNRAGAERSACWNCGLDIPIGDCGGGGSQSPLNQTLTVPGEKPLP